MFEVSIFLKKVILIFRMKALNEDIFIVTNNLFQNYF